MSDSINKRNFNDVLAEALHKFNRKTRADCFRTMTDEELAEYLSRELNDSVPTNWLDWLREETAE